MTLMLFASPQTPWRPMLQVGDLRYVGTFSLTSVQLSAGHHWGSLPLRRMYDNRHRHLFELRDCRFAG
jgi:hypothetical protein